MKVVPKKSLSQAEFDVIVIGGGPAGMMAAGTAATRGARVLLVEKNPTLGKKLLITGGGRCNVTNAETNVRTLLRHFKDSDKFLFSAFSQWDNTATRNYFHDRGLMTKVEDKGRVFPVTDKAQSVWEVLVTTLKTTGVTVWADDAVTGLKSDGANVTSITLQSGRSVSAPSYILATGGKSRPETGSTGDGFRWLAGLGHQVREPSVSLVPIALQETWIKDLAGIAIEPVKVTVFQHDKRFNSRTGKILFTHVGLSGPTILNMSSGIGDLLQYGPVSLVIDLLPTLDEGALDTLLITHLHKHSNKLWRNALAELFPTALARTLGTLSGIPATTPCHSITRDQRKDLGRHIKKLTVTVKSLLGVDKAIVTSGGVTLTEINFKTMQSRRYPNLYITGDLLDIDRPSGGYSLQLCWTTGFVAGNSVKW